MLLNPADCQKDESPDVAKQKKNELAEKNVYRQKKVQNKTKLCKKY